MGLSLQSRGGKQRHAGHTFRVPLPLVLLALAAAARAATPPGGSSGGGGGDAGGNEPADVAARWSRLDPRRWSLEQLQLALPLLRPPPGFEIDLYYKGGLLDSARSLALSGASQHPGGPVIVYVSTKLANSTYALVDADGDGEAEAMTVLLDGLDTPQGLDWKDGDLYVSGWQPFPGGRRGVIWRARGADAYALKGQPFPLEDLEVVTSRLPAERWHGERYMRFGPADGLLYISIGFPCNVCPERESAGGITFGTIYTLNTTLGDHGLKLYARGLRNVVGMEWHADDPSMLLMTDNGRDKMGDDLPDCTLHWADRPGLFFGFPFCLALGAGDPYVRNPGPGAPLPDPDQNPNGAVFNCSDPAAYRRPLQAFGPHVAPLGLRMLRWEQGRAWPRERYDRALIIAQHGSWDRSSKIGYRLVLARLAPLAPSGGSGQKRGGEGGGGTAPRVVEYEEFLTGFVGGRRGDPKDSQLNWGRPADVLQLPDGSLLVSDDGAHTVYRLRYTGASAGAHAPPSGGGDGAAKSAAGGAAASRRLLLAAAVATAACLLS